MTLAETSGPAPKGSRGPWLPRLIASRRFQSWAARFPLTRGIARRDGERLFDLVAGFAHSQVLMAVVETRLIHRVMDGAKPVDILAAETGIPSERMAILCNAAAALGLLKHTRRGFGPGRLGAAILGVPGLEAMVTHHRAFYRDLEDPVALFKGKDTELAHFWPYVFGAAQAEDPETAATYSDLMAESQALVAEETLMRIDLSDAQELLDVGGGTGAFLAAVGRAHKGPSLHLFDLPAVIPGAQQTFASAGLGDRATLSPGSFRDDALPKGADTISLVRVLYDHADETVLGLLSKIHDTLPEGGRLVVSEPMAGGKKTHRSTDVYFALYTMAMQTGRTRTPKEIKEFLRVTGFTDVKDHGTSRPFVTHVLSARKN